MSTANQAIYAAHNGLEKPVEIVLYFPLFCCSLFVVIHLLIMIKIISFPSLRIFHSRTSNNNEYLNHTIESYQCKHCQFIKSKRIFEDKISTDFVLSEKVN